MPLQVNLTSHLMSVTSHLSANSAGVQVIPPSLSFSTNTVQFPLTVDFPSSCQIQILLLLNKEGSIERWYTWIPATVYSAAVTALILPTLFLGKRLHPTVTALLLAVLYVGFLGACIGLIVHLEQWQSTLGRMFPSRAVTLYCCLPLLYVAYMVILLLRCGRHKSTLFIGLLRLLVYGVNCALCVGYWIAGYVLLGSLSVFQYFATNVVLTLYFVYLVVKFNRPPRKVRETGVVQGGGLRQIRIPTSLSVLWFTPLTPFASCFLFYLDLYLLSGSVASSDGGLRIEDLVRVYNLQLSIPLLFFQNIYGIALLATATAYHMPFVVVLFPSLFLWGLHLIYSVEQYVNEWRRWRERGVGVAAAAGWLSLKKAIEYLTEGDGAYANSYAPYRPKAGPPQGREDARYIQVLANHVEEDIERHGGTLRSRSRSHRSQAYPEGRSIIGVDDEEAIEFPAPPSRREYSARSDTSSLYQPQPPSPPPVSTAYYGNSVFANGNIHSNVTSVSRDDQVEETDGSLDPDYWPNSVQR
ncbi:hypothetical protein AGDE_07582 [Angomonas deanei]|uniref:Uncharacterized protein n=1 Tax=Angomonas deanei TaxID=59799 RepID=A0A7G2CMN9_9TRYP|nr:hypothetical protein AGDE_07582 [Angomonas deanei]CAD2219532.1 hypothetical protein, conserved [Angomonas deanei]|eukprot:EPY35111.1 hypothetical protein AGDE_07582 [Angomonas deanei]